MLWKQTTLFSWALFLSHLCWWKPGHLPVKWAHHERSRARSKEARESLHFKSQPTEVRKYSRQMSVSDGLCYSCLLSQPPNKHKIRVHFFHLIPVQFSPQKCSLPHPPSYLSESGIRPPDSRGWSNHFSYCHLMNAWTMLHLNKIWVSQLLNSSTFSPSHSTVGLH